MKKHLLIALCLICTLQTGHAQKVLDSVYTYCFWESGDSALCFGQKWDYDQRGNVTRMARYSWNSQTKQWHPWYFYPGDDWFCWGRFDLEYDNSGNLIAKTGYYPEDWGERKAWNNITRELFEYDGDGNRVTSQWLEWDYFAKDWKNVRSAEYRYVEYDYKIIQDQYTWNPDKSEWKPASREILNKDTFGKLVGKIGYLWDSVTRDWILNTKTDFVFNSAGIPILRISYKRIRVNSADTWQETERYEVNLDSHGRPQTEFYNWNSQPNDKFEYTYDHDNHLVSKAWMFCPNYPDWNIYKQWEWRYHPSGQRQTEIYRGSFMDFDMVFSMEIVTAFDPEGDTISRTYYYLHDLPGSPPIQTDYYYYHGASTGTGLPITSKVSIFPNCSSGPIHITGLTAPAELRIWSMQGQLMRKTNQTGETADLTDLPKGMYILELLTVDGKVQRSRIIRE